MMEKTDCLLKDNEKLKFQKIGLEVAALPVLTRGKVVRGFFKAPNKIRIFRRQAWDRMSREERKSCGELVLLLAAERSGICVSLRSIGMEAGSIEKKTSDEKGWLALLLDEQDTVYICKK